MIFSSCKICDTNSVSINTIVSENIKKKVKVTTTSRKNTKVISTETKDTTLSKRNRMFDIHDTSNDIRAEKNNTTSRPPNFLTARPTTIKDLFNKAHHQNFQFLTTLDVIMHLELCITITTAINYQLLAKYMICVTKYFSKGCSLFINSNTNSIRTQCLLRRNGKLKPSTKTKIKTLNISNKKDSYENILTYNSKKNQK